MLNSPSHPHSPSCDCSFVSHVGQFSFVPVVNAFLDEGKRDWAWQDFSPAKIWREKTRGGGTLVGVVDTFYDPRHPDFSGQVHAARDFTGSGEQDGSGHGTWCGSCIAGKDNGEYAIGVAPEAKLAIAKGLDDRGSGRGDQIGAAIEWCAAQGCDVISLSLGSPVADRYITRAVEKAIALGIIVIVAAGNSGAGTFNAIARIPGVIAVGSMNRDGTVSRFSGGERPGDVDVLGPGERVIGALPADRGYLGEMTGTSMATPFIAGLAALCKAMDKKLTPDGFREILASSSRDYGEPGYDSRSGWGIVVPDALVGRRQDGGTEDGGKGDGGQGEKDDQKWVNVRIRRDFFEVLN